MTNWKTTTGHYENSVWDKAKTACTKYLQKVATKGKTTDYTYAAASFQHIFRLGPDDQLFHSMLGQISVEEHGEGTPVAFLSCSSSRIVFNRERVLRRGGRGRLHR